MKNKNRNTLNQIALVIAKITEICHWFGVICMILLLGCSLFAKDWLSNILNQNIQTIGYTLTTYGFEISILQPNGTIHLTAITLFAIGAIMILSLFAMIFRNAYLILKTAKGKTWFSKGATPFQPDIIRMLREIGIFLILVPIIGCLMSIIAQAIIGVEIAEISVNLENIIIGLLILCLSQFFAYGAELQKDVDGLV